MENLGSVRIAPNVLATIACMTALSVPGVARMSAGLAGGVSRLIGREQPVTGVKVQVTEGAVHLDLHLVVKPGFSMLDVGQHVQTEVSEALSQMVGMPVSEVNVFVQDVEREG